MRAALVVFALLWVSAQAPTVEAQGISLLGMCHKDFNCNLITYLWRDQPTIYTGWLEQTFGEDCKCADRLLRSFKQKIIRAHLINSPCMRNRRCGRYEPLYGYTKTSASRAALQPDSRFRIRFHRIVARLKRRLEQAQNTTCYVSPCLECDLDERARRTLLDYVSAHLPQCILVDNPYGQRCIKGYVCESHGSHPRAVAPCIVDLDGTDPKSVDLRKWVDATKSCEIAFYWSYWMNCVRGVFVDPRDRSCVYPVATYKQTKDILCRYFWRPLLGTC